MIKPSREPVGKIDHNRGIWILMPALLSLAMAAILFPLPHPAARVNQPFKVEFLIALVLLIFLGVYYRRANSDAAGSGSRPALLILCGLIAFVIWSALSGLWSHSIDSVLHHTLLWSVYLAYFFVFTQNARRETGFRLIIATFIAVSLITGVLCVFDYATLTDFAANEGPIKIRYGKYAELLTTLSPVLWAALAYVRGRHMWLLLSAAVLSWTTSMLALSKGAFLAGIAGFIIFFIGSALLSDRAFRRRIMTLAAGWVLLTVGMQIAFSLFSAVPSTTDYITGKADPTRSTSAMRVFTWKIAGEMARDHWLKGVGADSFGLMFNRSRAAYRLSHPDGPKEEIAEEFLVERAHNEPLQVLAELGVVGMVLLVVPFLFFGVLLLRCLYLRKLRLSPALWGAVAGMAAFAVSSQFSSFSFRSAQNGVVFFMVFAVAVSEVGKSFRVRPGAPRSYRFTALIAASGVALLLTAYCSTKIFAEYSEYRAEGSGNFREADRYFRNAVAADPEYAASYMTWSMANLTDGDPARSVPLMRMAVDRGIGITPVYSRLAKMQVAERDPAGSEATYHEALTVYPNSIFLRIEYAVFLESQNRPDEAAIEAGKARSVDLRQANGWYAIMKTGSVNAYLSAKADPNIALPAELLPFDAVRQYLDKIPGLEPPASSSAADDK